MSGDDLVGRKTEQAALEQMLAAAKQGSGGVVLLAGEAGVGKTRLLHACLARSGLVPLAGHSNESATPPYGPVAAAIRSFLRAQPGVLHDSGPLAPQLALLLPELGPPPPHTDAATLIEALCQTFAAIARHAPAALVLDDLQWADNATLALLPILASALAHERLLIIATYRNDAIGRGHPLRRLCNELRRAHALREIVVEPFDHSDTTALAARVLGQTLSPALASALYERTEGVPLFVEELAGMLRQRGHLRPGLAGLELASGMDLPIPDTLRNAIGVRLDGLPEQTVRLLEYAVLAGREFDMALVAELAGGADGFDALLACGLLIEATPGRGMFRHALAREAIASDITWSRRRLLHRQLAEHGEAAGATPEQIAHHWLAAKEPDRARAALLRAAERAGAMHAYRDAAAATQHALELWPNGADEAERLDALDRFGQYAQLCGMLPDAARAWRDVAEAHRHNGALRRYAATQRKLATVAELGGHWEAAQAAHEAAAHAFAASEQPAEAATERLSSAAHLRSAGQYRAALELLATAIQEATQTERFDLQARIIGLEGNVRVRMGQAAAGMPMVQRGLALALEHNQAHAAAEIYQRLADSLEHTGDYGSAKATYLTAFDFCQTNALPATAQICIACLTTVLRQTGEWERAMTLCREVLASPDSLPHARTVASGMLGSLHVLRGQARQGQPLLRESAALAQRIELAAMQLMSTWGLALLDESTGNPAAAAERARSMLTYWQQNEDIHYAIAVLRWSASLFATTHAHADLRACANALAHIASSSGQPEALSALAHALGEIALLEGEPAHAVRHFSQALDLLQDVALPYCHASSQFRAGVACAAANQHAAATNHFANAYRTARKLGARPLATRIAQALEALGEPIAERLGPNAAGRFRTGDLTRRQHEILQLVAQGHTNAEIAHALVLSPRTVEMHVANILAILDSRSRAEAVRRAAERGLLDHTV